MTGWEYLYPGQSGRERSERAVRVDGWKRNDKYWLRNDVHTRHGSPAAAPGSCTAVSQGQKQRLSPFVAGKPEGSGEVKPSPKNLCHVGVGDTPWPRARVVASPIPLPWPPLKRAHKVASRRLARQHINAIQTLQPTSACDLLCGRETIDLRVAASLLHQASVEDESEGWKAPRANPRIHLRKNV